MPGRRLTHPLDRKIIFFLLITVIKGAVPDPLHPGSGLSYLYGSRYPGSPSLDSAPRLGYTCLPSHCPLPTQPIGRVDSPAALGDFI